MALESLNEFIDAISKATTVEEIHDVCTQFGHLYDFDNFIYGAQLPTSFTQPTFIYVTSYPKEWRDRYINNNYISIDPIVSHCANNLTPLDWQEIKTIEKEDKRIKNFMGEAVDFGLKSGISLSAHTAGGEFAIFSLASSECHRQAEKSIKEALPYSHLFTAYLHEAVRKLFDDTSLRLNQIQLTDREHECLLWSAEGKTTWETAKILNISERTVVFHVQNASKKLNVVNRQHAVARAVSTGLITPLLN